MDKFYQTIIKQAMDEQDLLSDWENEFIDSIADRDNDYNLSDKQKNVLNKIEHKIALG